MRYAIGTEVRVLEAVSERYLGVGVLLTPYDSDSEDNPMPEIRMPDGKIILGWDCWWISVADTEGLPVPEVGT